MIAIASLIAILPAVMAMPSALVERTGPSGTVVPSVTTNGKTYYARGCYDELKSMFPSSMIYTQR